MRNNDSCLSLLPAHLIKQTSLKEPSWMSLYKGLVAYLVYLYLESLGMVRRVINARSENRSSGIADLEQVLIHFM